MNKFHSIPRAAGLDDYIPLDTIGRATAHLTAAGIAQGWPIPLTRVGEPTPTGFDRRWHDRLEAQR